MRKISGAVMAAGLVLTIVVSNAGSFISDGKKLDELRDNVLRLHILANSDSIYDQNLKLKVRDALLEQSDEIFGDAESIEQAEFCAESRIELIEQIAAETLAEENCTAPVSAEITDMYFEERVYGDITMPAGEYTALRVEIGEAEGQNWWCVMYPPLCIPAACSDDVDDDEETEEQFFDDEERDIMCNPQKYKIRFAIWDKLKSWIND